MKRYIPSQDTIRRHWAGWLTANGKAHVIENLCWGCELDLDLERAHIVAQVDGGTATKENLVLLCHICHKVSELMPPDQFLNWLAKRTKADYLADVQSKETMRLLRLSMSHRAKQSAQKRKMQGKRVGGAPKTAPEVVALVTDLRAKGLSYESVATELNTRGAKPVRGKSFYASSVRALCLSEQGQRAKKIITLNE